jgi:hypothetical protein
MLSSPRKPSSTIRIFSSAESRRRVFWRISLTALSDDTPAPLAIEFLAAALQKTPRGSGLAGHRATERIPCKQRTPSAGLPRQESCRISCPGPGTLKA